MTKKIDKFNQRELDRQTNQKKRNDDYKKKINQAVRRYQALARVKKWIGIP